MLLSLSKIMNGSNGINNIMIYLFLSIIILITIWYINNNSDMIIFFVKMNFFILYSLLNIYNLHI